MNPEQERKLNEVWQAVVGNEATGTTGLVKRVRSLEKWREGMMLKLATVTGGAIVIGLLLKYVFKG
jgi:hypothetical protein